MPSSLREKLFIAFSSFSPPRLTYFGFAPLISSFTSSGYVLPGLSAFWLSAYIMPDIIRALAFSLLSAKPASKTSISSLFFAGIIDTPNAYLIFYLSNDHIRIQTCLMQSRACFSLVYDSI